MLIHQPQRSEDKEVEQYLNKSLKLRENLARHRTARLQRAAATRQRRCPHPGTSSDPPPLRCHISP